MRSFAILFIGAFLVIETCAVDQLNFKQATTKAHPSSVIEIIDFEKQVLPVMAKNCSPCHFTGGKMYERMPFDKDTTIIRHGEKILGRITKEEEHTLLKNFLQQNKNGTHP